MTATPHWRLFHGGARRHAPARPGSRSRLSPVLRPSGPGLRPRQACQACFPYAHAPMCMRKWLRCSAVCACSFLAYGIGADGKGACVGAAWRAATRCRVGQRATRSTGSRTVLRDTCQVPRALCRVCQVTAARRASGRMARRRPGLETLEGPGRGPPGSWAAQGFRMRALWGV